jgi:hypothetical protein
MTDEEQEQRQQQQEQEQQRERERAAKARRLVDELPFSPLATEATYLLGATYTLLCRGDRASDPLASWAR